MEETRQLGIADYWAIVRRRRWWIVTPVFLVWAAVLGSSFFIPEKYMSETMILVEQQRVPQHYVVSNIGTDLQERLQSMIQQILSRTRLLKIIEDVHLYPEAAQKDVDAVIQRMRDDIKIELINGRTGSSELTAFKVAYSAPSPKVAQQVTSRLTSLFIEENLRNRQKQSEDTTAFLESQLEAARAALTEQEERLRDFKAKHLGQLPQQLDSNVRILSGLQDRLQSTSSVLNQAYQQKLYLESLLAQYKEAGSAVPSANGAVVTPAMQLRQLKEQLADLKARYTERHPEIVRLTNKIAAAEQALAKSASDESAETQGSASTSSMPAMQIESQLKVNALEIENRKRELKQIEAEIERYQARLNLTPVTEQQLATVTRDHEQSRSNYESLLAKKMQSQLATNLEKQQQGEQFRIIDPPSLPQKPYFPDRLRFSLMGLGGGFAVAFALVLLIELIGARVHSERDLDAGLPVLVEIPSVVVEPHEYRKRLRWVFEAGGMTVLLITIPAVSALVHFRG